MSLILMFNPANQHLQELDDTETDRIARMEESGWRRVEKYELLAVYSPALNDHKTVLKADEQTWLGRGYFAEPTWVYHPDNAPRMVSAAAASDLLTDGWYDSPAKFPNAEAIVEQAVKAAKAKKE